MRKAALSQWNATLVPFKFFPYDGSSKKQASRMRRLTKTLLIMKLIIFFLVAGLLNAQAKGLSQTINFSGKKVAIEKAFDEIGGELHTQYTLGYSPVGASEAGYHEIKVTLADPKFRNLKLRSRPGYYVSTSDE